MTKHVTMVTKMGAMQFTLLWDAVKDKEVGDEKRQQQKRNKLRHQGTQFHDNHSNCLG